MNDTNNGQAGQNDEKTVVLSARAMRTLIMNQFGEEIAGSRQFNAIPSLELKDGVTLVWTCPMPDCKGEMHYTGESWASIPQGIITNAHAVASRPQSLAQLLGQMCRDEY